MSPKYKTTYGRRTALAAAVVVGMTTPLSVANAVEQPQTHQRETSVIEAPQSEVDEKQDPSAAEDPSRAQQEPSQDSQDVQRDSGDEAAQDLQPTDATEDTVLPEQQITEHSAEPDEGAEQNQPEPEEELAQVSDLSPQEDVKPSTQRDGESIDETKQVESEHDMTPEIGAKNPQQQESTAKLGTVDSQKEVSGDVGLDAVSDEEKPDGNESEQEDSEGDNSEEDSDGDDSEEDSDGDDSEEGDNDQPQYLSDGTQVAITEGKPDTQYKVLVGEKELSFTTDSNGKANLEVTDALTLEPGEHTLVISGPDGYEDDITFYSTETHVEQTTVNIHGLSPSNEYLLTVDGLLTNVGVTEFRPGSDGAYSIDLVETFPEMTPGMKQVTISGEGYESHFKVQVPMFPPDPEPEPEPDPDPEPEPETDPDPGPETQAGNEETGTSGVGTANADSAVTDDTGQDENTVDSAEAEDSRQIESLEDFRASDAVETNRRFQELDSELPTASGDEAQLGNPGFSNNAATSGLESAPMRHDPVTPNDASRAPEAPSQPSNEPAEASQQESPEITADDSFKAERTSGSLWPTMAWVGAFLALIGAVVLIVTGRRKKT